MAQHRERIAAARESLGALGTVLWQAGSGGCAGDHSEDQRADGGGGLAGLLGEVDALGGACDAARVAVTAEALDRGETSSGPLALSPVQWVRRHAPTTRAGGAGQVVALAHAFAKPVNEAVKEAVDAGRLPVRSAAAVVVEADKLRPLLADGADAPVVAGLVDMAAEHGPRGCRLLRSALLARYGRDGVLQDEQDAGKTFVSLSQPHDSPGGISEYRLSLDAEGRAVLEAALGPLSAPRPVEGERDLRSSDRRRGDALVQLVRRAVAADGTVGKNSSTTLFLTMDWESLRDAVGAATTLGSVDSGSHLAAETVRRLACDASVIPVVLGSHGEVLDLGRNVRLFTPAQTRRLWLRDGGCTFPGCDAPPSWTDGHHLVHWADFGSSDLTNAALLCERHHTIAHQRRLAGRVVLSPEGERVVWDLARGSYDELLALRAAQERA
nr:HNH endonuclease signature motif containing protein [Pedococcus badiiscoriae]